jgi:SnoaL-like domain
MSNAIAPLIGLRRPALSAAIGSSVVSEAPINDSDLRGVLAEYLTILQRHPSAEEMMAAILTDDFETGFVGGHLWKGLDGLRDFLSQRDGFFDEHHEVKDVLELEALSVQEVEAKTRLEFFLRGPEGPERPSREYTGSAFHTWRVRLVDGKWRVAAQLVDGFEDLNDNAKELFSTPDEGLKR